MTLKSREKVEEIEYIDPPPMRDEELSLRLAAKVPPDHKKGWVPSYHFEMVHSGDGTVLGHINLRIGNTENLLMFAGHIGFAVLEPFRGHHYAARSCQLLIPLIRHHRLDPAWLTCNVDNEPSKRTMELIGAKYVETVTMPDDYPYAPDYPPDSRTKRRYRWDVL
jgi:tagatose 1,6-diphosphate aldolase